jgi:hypothetical protein
MNGPGPVPFAVSVLIDIQSISLCGAEPATTYWRAAMLGWQGWVDGNRSEIAMKRIHIKWLDEHRGVRDIKSVEMSRIFLFSKPLVAGRLKAQPRDIACTH